MQFNILSLVSFYRKRFGKDDHHTMAANDESYTLPSLIKSSFNACNEIQRYKYYEFDVPHVDLQACCVLLFEFLAKYTEIGGPPGNIGSMFARVHAHTDRFLDLCMMAATHGHIECLKFAHAMGCP